MRQRYTIELLKQAATDRKLLLLDCAIIRHAPFSEGGRTIWQLLPEFKWFSDDRTSALMRQPPRVIKFTGHDAIELVELIADGRVDPDGREDANWYFRYTTYHAESDIWERNSDDASELGFGVARRIWQLDVVRPEANTILDDYLTTDSGTFFCYGRDLPIHPTHRGAVLRLIDDIFGNPFRPVTFDFDWRTSIAVELARHMYESRDFTAMPILADALDDAGCTDADILAHCRDLHAVHARGCWVVDLVLGKE